MFVWAFDMTGKKVLCVQVRAGTFPTHPPLYARVWARASLFLPLPPLYAHLPLCVKVHPIDVHQSAGMGPCAGTGVFAV